MKRERRGAVSSKPTIPTTMTFISSKIYSAVSMPTINVRRIWKILLSGSSHGEACFSEASSSPAVCMLFTLFVNI